MKKVAFFACAAMMLASVAFTGCKNNDELGNDYNGEVVKTEFSISLPNQAVGNGPRRLPSTTVQVSGLSEFQGMTNITLVPFAKEAKLVAADNRLGANINLTDITADGASSTNTLNATSHATVYTDVSIPLTTASFLFYAKSRKSGNKEEVGSLITNLNNTTQPATPGDITFDLEPIIASVGSDEATVASVTASGTKGANLIAYLNAVLNATDGTDTWRTYNAGAALKAMCDAYKTMEALSSFQVQRVMEDLYKSLKPLTASNTLAAAISAAITNASYATVDGSDNLTLASDLAGFPANIKLPDGAVRIVYDDAVNGFRALTYNEYTADNNAQLNLYTYPSALWYYANSVIKTSNSSKKALYTDNSKTWQNILDAHEAAAAVNTLTRAVAINDVIQYGVARLDVTVKVNGATLDDNATDAAHVPTPADGYTVTGVLVGNQKNVGFDFNPNGTKIQTIYDCSMTPASMVAKNGVASAANSTLVLATPEGAAPTNDVMIAVELQNTSGQDFVGVDGNIILKDAKFYLVARLAASSASVTQNQVFKQDYTTTANLTISSLKSAYSTVPDLRTPELELGFSVDLNWTPGNVYNVEIP